MRKFLLLSLALFSLAASAHSQSTSNSTLQLSANSGAIAVAVNCDKGESLNHTLSRLSKHVPATVSVKGTCTEFVQVIGFDNLTLNGLVGAALVEPSTGAGNLGTGVLVIGSSRSVTVNGLSIQGDIVAPILVTHGSSDIRLLNLHTQGWIFVEEHSQALLAHVVGQNAGYTPLGIYDLSDVHIEHCLFENSNGAPFHAGMSVRASHVTMFDTTIRNMQVGIDAGTSSIIDLVTYNTYTPLGGPSDVIIDSPAGTNYWGVTLGSGSSLNVWNAKLVIDHPGQPWGGDSGGIRVSDGSTLSAAKANLEITGSDGQGILVMNNSHATLTGGTVTGGKHGGVVLANLSTLDVTTASGIPLTLIGSNDVDLFCDSSSKIAGSANLAGVPTAQCANVLAGEATLP
jgi:hypothetical protein